MRCQTVSHEELLKAWRGQWDNEKCGDMIARAPNLIDADAAPLRERPYASAGRLLALAAAPTFAIMALLAGIQDGGMPGMLCSAAHRASLTGMVPMYLLMSAFHSAPWLRLITNRRGGGYQA
jgi:hypothetical protein